MMTFLAQQACYANTVTISIVLFTLLATLHYTSGRKIHPKEPRLVRPWVPVLGHLIGMALHGGRYIKQLGSVSCHHPRLDT
jgi:hypothetical protein